MTQDLSMVRGTTGIFVLTLKNPEDGTPRVKTSSQTIIFGLKKNIKDEERLILKKIEVTDGDGRYILTIAPEETEELDPGTYWYDINMRDGEAFHPVVGASRFTLNPNVTKCGDCLA